MSYSLLLVATVVHLCGLTGASPKCVPWDTLLKVFLMGGSLSFAAG